MANDEEAPLLVDNLEQSSDSSSSSSSKHHWRDAFVLSVAFLLIFLAYGAAQNLETTVNSEGDLGTICLGILYTSFTFFSLVASLVVKVLGSKNSVILGSTGYWFFIAANLVPSWYTMVPASFYLGFSASILWVGQGTYLTSTALSHAKYCRLEEGTVIGKFNGVFWGFFASHQIVGNLISLAILSNKTAEGSSNTKLLFTVFLCMMTFGTVLILFLSKRGNKEEEPTDSSVSLCSSVTALSKSVVAPLLDVKMLLIIPLIAYSGLQSAFVWAEFTKEIVTPSLGVSGVGGAMAVYGVFDAVCSLAAGRLTFGVSSIAWMVFGGCLLQAIVFIWILLKYSLATGVLAMVYPLLMAAMLGIGDAVLNTQLSALLGILFKHDMEGAFAQLKVWQSGAIAVVFFINAYVSMQEMLVTMLVAICVSMGGVLFLTLYMGKAGSSPSS